MHAQDEILCVSPMENGELFFMIEAACSVDVEAEDHRETVGRLMGFQKIAECCEST